MTHQVLVKMCEDIKFNVSKAGLPAVTQLLKAIQDHVQNDAKAHNIVLTAIKELEKP